MKLRIDSSMAAGCSLCNFPPSNNWFGSLQDECFSFFYTERIRMVTVFLFFHHSGTLLHQLLLKRHFKDLSWVTLHSKGYPTAPIESLVLQVYKVATAEGPFMQRKNHNCWERALPISHRIDQGVVCLPTFILDFMVNVRMEIHHACILWVYIVFLHLFP